MDYTSEAQLLETVSSRILIELSNDEPEANSINTAMVAAHIANGTAQINSYVSNRFSLPISNTNLLAVLKTVNNTLAFCSLVRRRRELSNIENEQEQWAYSTLKQIANGDIFANLDKDESYHTKIMSLNKQRNFLLVICYNSY
jgi:phage gp36-like protein